MADPENKEAEKKSASGQPLNGAALEKNTTNQPSEREILAYNLRDLFRLSPESTDFLLRTWDAIQFFDDLADNTPTTRDALDKTIWDFFIGLSANPFYQKYIVALQSQLATMILKWQASDRAERAGSADERSFVWRAGYYDLILFVFACEYGADKAKVAALAILGSYGEKFEDYLKEFPSCQPL